MQTLQQSKSDGIPERTAKPGTLTRWSALRSPTNSLVRKSHRGPYCFYPLGGHLQTFGREYSAGSPGVACPSMRGERFTSETLRAHRLKSHTESPVHVRVDTLGTTTRAPSLPRSSGEQFAGFGSIHLSRPTSY